ncbi:NAD-dependent epimerase/dehydratase family protein [Halosimplex salinum]|uniref:NAD-dependent epimerase/dehydratase family protein n=1 Tax=Halosimplex salinum TaxID=1710538 RepID=UPI000F476D47|nr:NAD-dependent epimerase/dehydratase family protein [Halosimplex salinum]
MSHSELKIAVTGGAGFIGSHLTAALSERGHEVLIVDNFSAGRSDARPDGVSLIRQDIRDPAITDIVADFDPDVVYHLAARHYIPDCNENPEDAFDVNVIGTRRVLEGATRADVETVVFASSAAVYGPDTKPHVESEQPRPTDIYGRTKLVGEDLVEKFATDAAFDPVVFRLFNVYGPSETNPHVIPAILDQIEEETDSISLGNLRPERDFVHVADVVDALLLPLNGSEMSARRYNVGTGSANSVAELVETIRELVTTEFVVDQDDERIRDSDRPYLCADIEQIESELDWTPSYDLRAGLQQLIETEYEQLRHA